MRPVAELIQELDTEAAKFDMTALVVAFQTRTKTRAFYVWSDDKTKLSNLKLFLGRSVAGVRCTGERILE